MAYKDSDEIATNSNYTLGDYSFRVERSSVPGSTNDKIEAICTKDGKNARKSIQVLSSKQLLGWYVEANETEATVYAILGNNIPTGDVPTGNGTIVRTWDGYVISAPATLFNCSDTYYWISREYFTVTAGTTTDWAHSHLEHDSIVGDYYIAGDNIYIQNKHDYVPYIEESPYDKTTSIRIILGQQEDESGDVIVGRFAIEIEEAGGVGPGGGIGGGWEDPEDYDEDWEEGDPTHTLYVTVTGALSGRHNDPIEDPSYSYIPTDKDTVKDYGCGGDGGHGGGGGAGASTVVVHKFATNQANSKEVTAIARRHGYGSGGGKGGKGGDGCILVYY